MHCFRPTDVYGLDDSFLCYWFSYMRRSSHSIPMWKKGLETIKAPLHISDMTSGIMNALDNPDTKGAIIEAYGPERYLMYDLMCWMAEITNRDAKDYNFSIGDLRMDPVPWIKALLCQNILGTKWFGRVTIDKMERTALSDEILGLPNLEDLGIKAQSVVEKMPFEIKVHAMYQHHFPQTPDDIPNPPPPRPLSRLEEKEVLKKNHTGVLASLGIF